MRAQCIEVFVFSRYFLKLTLSTPVNYLYKIFLPALLLIMNSIGKSDPELVIRQIIPWLSYLLLVAGINVIADYILLREQGYLKQYHTLVSSHWVIFLAKAIVEFLFLFLSIVAILGLLMLIFSSQAVALLRLLLVALLAATLLYPSFLALASLLFLFRISARTINTYTGLLTLGAIGLLYISVLSIGWWNLVNPLAVSNHVLASFYGLEILSPLFLAPPLVYLPLGFYSVSTFNILPLEGI